MDFYGFIWNRWRDHLSIEPTVGNQPAEEKKRQKMKTETKDKPAKGRAAFIHKLRADGLTKAQALERAQTKFNVAPGLFERIWKRKERGAKTKKAK